MKSRYAYFSSFATTGDLTPTEEEASRWLWDSPRLLDWPRNISWLSSRSEVRRSAARLLGLDSIGSLIVVEIMVDKGEAPNPFESLVFEVKSSSSHRDWTAEVLREKWRKSCARHSLDALRICEQRVERKLDLRDALGNPPPVFVGVVATTRLGFRLSPKATKSFEQLQKRVGEERVLLRLISGSLDFRGLRIRCGTPEGNEATAPLQVGFANARRDRRRSRRSPCLTRSRVSRYGQRPVARS